MSSHWGYFVGFIVCFTVIGCYLLLMWTRKLPVKDVKEGEVLSHSFDGIEEYNNPLPRWWLCTFLFGFVFLIGYLLFYPGLGQFAGVHEWSSRKALAQAQAEKSRKYDVIFEDFAAQPVTTLIEDPKALRIGQRLFIHHCSACHGPDGRGSIGFPNLTDQHWIYGGEPETIKQTITQGRQGMMPSQEMALGSDQNIESVVQYIMKINQRPHEPEMAAVGESHFKKICAACHGPDAEGNRVIGAPNLTHNAWTFGGTPLSVELTIRNGRHAVMPAHAGIISPEKIHLLTAFVYHLSQPEAASESNEVIPLEP